MNYGRMNTQGIVVWLRLTTTPCAARSRTARDWPGHGTQTTPVYAARPRIWGFTLSASPARRRAGWPDTQGTIAVMQAISYPPTPPHSPARPAHPVNINTVGRI